MYGPGEAEPYPVPPAAPGVQTWDGGGCGDARELRPGTIILGIIAKLFLHGQVGVGGDDPTSRVFHFQIVCAE